MLLHLLTAGYGTFLPCQPRQPMSGFRGKAAVPPSAAQDFRSAKSLLIFPLKRVIVPSIA
jgi:hypothetical protein